MVLTDKNCAVCGAAFQKPDVVSRRTWETRRYCSRACAGRVYSARASARMASLSPHICGACGITYRPHDVRSKFCSPQCALGRFVNRRGENHWSWKGGRVDKGNGYMAVAVSRESPYAGMIGRTGYVLEHRLVMAQSLGRPLRSDETVHHINGIKDDNRPENLQLRQGPHGKNTRHRCGACGSYDIVTEEIG